jgi:hypothetical protein
MTDVEALLSVDAGRLPPGCSAFRARDPEARTRALRAGLAVMFALAAVGSAVAGVAHEGIALLVLTASIFAILATPDEPDPEEARHKRATLVVTPTGMIVRDQHGLRRWEFHDVVEVTRVLSEGSAGLWVVTRNGASDFVDTEVFERGERLWGILRRLAPSVPPPGPTASRSPREAA